MPGCFITWESRLRILGVILMCVRVYKVKNSVGVDISEFNVLLANVETTNKKITKPNFEP